MNKFKQKVTCPYCGHRQFEEFEAMGLYHAPEVVRCDDEEGGCGRVFVIKAFFSVRMVSYEVEQGSDSI